MADAVKHLQALQAMRPLEPPVPLLGHTALGEPRELFGSPVLDEKGTEELRNMARTAEFWISLLEGEQSELQEEIAKHKKSLGMARG